MMLGLSSKTYANLKVAIFDEDLHKEMSTDAEFINRQQCSKRINKIHLPPLRELQHGVVLDHGLDLLRQEVPSLHAFQGRDAWFRRGRWIDR
jgi:hypothetical protein